MKKLIVRILNFFGYGIVSNNAISADFDGDIKHIIERVLPYTMTSPERLNALCQAVKYISLNRIEGDIVECGVWRGGSMLAVSQMLYTIHDTSRTLWMYDTFEGMTTPTDHDRDTSGDSARKLLLREKKTPDSLVWCYASLDDVRENMKQSEYPDDKIRFVKGKVEQTLATTTPDKIALLRLDTDWYESTKAEMKHLFPRLVKGGVLLIDDYGHWQGSRKAIDDYIAANQIKLLLNRIDYTGRIAVKTF